MVVDGKTRGERWNGRDKHAGREGRRRRGNLQKQRLPRGLQLRMHLSERGPWRLRGWLRFLPVCRNHLCVCVRIIHPPALFIFSFSFSSLATLRAPDSPFVSTIDHSGTGTSFLDRLHTKSRRSFGNSEGMLGLKEGFGEDFRKVCRDWTIFL